MNPLLVLAIGIGVVFLGLLCLIGIIYLMSFIYRTVSGERKMESIGGSKQDLSEIAPAAEKTVVSAPALSPAQRRSMMAAVSAAVAEYMGTEPDALRILSVRRVGGVSVQPAGDRRELMAAVSAAIAMQLDTDVSAIRIHSVKRV